MYPHHAVHRELAYDRQATLLHEAKVDDPAAPLLAQMQREQELAETLSPATGLVAAWIARCRSAPVRPVFHRG